MTGVAAAYPSGLMIQMNLPAEPEEVNSKRGQPLGK